MSPEMIGSVGVGLLLLAFVLNVLKRMDENSTPYLLLNFFGAGLSCWYAWLSDTVPFLILEGIWALAALTRLLTLQARKSGSPVGGEPL